MDKVDLDTAEGRRAYRDELNGVARPTRDPGFGVLPAAKSSMICAMVSGVRSS